MKNLPIWVIKTNGINHVPVPSQFYHLFGINGKKYLKQAEQLVLFWNFTNFGLRSRRMREKQNLKKSELVYNRILIAKILKLLS
ncbi:hypothetical protein BpHYR1_024910 [Brachionus plicatilis]|uniref:Uncharacterized protein n=1 Tax=Brachionus plicatilis TaxID=10195 RepID=A0A3M7QKT8_BRAPC|nr:hypothetical protein BpHYR1_024910 [Brachionus plicatilis]